MLASAVPRRRRVQLVVALLVVAIQATFFHAPQWNQSARLAATVAFVEPNTPYTGTFRIDGLRRGDRLPTEDWAEAHGAFYSNKAPGVSLLGLVPYYAIYHLERAAKLPPRTPQNTRVNAYLLNLWISVFWNAVAALMLIRRLSRLGLYSERGALAVGLVYAFATLVLPFGCSEWGHTTAAAFITLGILSLLDETAAGAVLAGFWFGAAMLTEYIAGVSLVLGGCFALCSPGRLNRAYRFALGAALPVFGLLLYQKICFGAYLATAPSLSNPVFLQPGKAAGLFGAPSFATVWRILFENERGLFFQNPILILAVAGALSLYRSGRRAFVVFAGANVVLYLASISAMEQWSGGATTSMRYMIVALPFICTLLPDIHAFRYRKLFVLLFVTSAAEMFMLTATSTMAFTDHPLSDFAVVILRRGYPLAFNPLLPSIGTSGLLAVAVTYAAALAWLLSVAFSNQAQNTADAASRTGRLTGEHGCG